MTPGHHSIVGNSIDNAAKNGSTGYKPVPADWAERARTALARARAYVPLQITPALVERSCGHTEHDTAVTTETRQIDVVCLDCFDPDRLFPREIHRA